MPQSNDAAETKPLETVKQETTGNDVVSGHAARGKCELIKEKTEDAKVATDRNKFRKKSHAKLTANGELAFDKSQCILHTFIILEYCTNERVLRPCRVYMALFILRLCRIWLFIFGVKK